MERPRGLDSSLPHLTCVVVSLIHPCCRIEDFSYLERMGEAAQILDKKSFNKFRFEICFNDKLLSVQNLLNRCFLSKIFKKYKIIQMELDCLFRQAMCCCFTHSSLWPKRRRQVELMGLMIEIKDHSLILKLHMFQ